MRSRTIVAWSNIATNNEQNYSIFYSYIDLWQTGWCYFVDLSTQFAYIFYVNVRFWNYENRNTDSTQQCAEKNPLRNNLGQLKPKGKIEHIIAVSVNTEIHQSPPKYTEIHHKASI